MKPFSFLLSLYILIIPLIPCADANGCEEISNYAWTSGSEDHNEESPNDACSDFCYCSCCTATTVFSLNTVFELNPQECIFSLNTDYTFILHDNYLNIIWQPPRVS